jgi:hypothetical protein
MEIPTDYNFHRKKLINGTSKMKELNRIVVDFVELRVIKDNGSQWCEILEAGKWIRASAANLHLLSNDKKIHNWLNQHFYSPNITLKFSVDKK